MPKLVHEGTAFFKLLEGEESGRSERLKRVLDKLDGVLEVQINFILDIMMVKYDADKVSRERIKKKVDRNNHLSQF